MSNFIASVELVAIVEGGASSVDNLSKEQDETKCVPFVTWQRTECANSTASDNGQLNLIQFQVIDNSGTAALRMERGSSLDEVSYAAYVVEFGSDCNVAQVDVDSWTGTSLDVDIGFTIQEGLNKAFCVFYHHMDAQTDDFNDICVSAHFKSESTVTLTRGTGGATSLSGTLFVVEDTGSNFNVQHGDINFSQAVTNTLTINPITMAETFVIASTHNNQGDDDSRSAAFRVDLQDATHVRAIRHTADTTAALVRVQAVSLANGNVYRALQDFPSTTDHIADTTAFTEVDPLLSMAWAPNHGNGINVQSASTSSADVCDGFIKVIIDSNNTGVEMDRLSNGDQAVKFAWEVIEWEAGAPTTAAKITALDAELTYDAIAAKITALDAEITHSLKAGKITAVDAELTFDAIAAKITALDAELTYTPVPAAKITALDAELTYDEIAAKITALDAEITHSLKAGKVTAVDAELTFDEIAGKITALDAELTFDEIAGKITALDAELTYDEIAAKITALDAEITHTIKAAKITALDAEITYTTDEASAKITALDAELTYDAIAAKITALDAEITHSLKAGKITALDAELSFDEITAKITALDAEITYTTDVPEAKITALDAELTYDEIAAKITALDAEITHTLKAAKITALDAELTYDAVAAKITALDAELTYNEIAAKITALDAEITLTEIAAKITALDAEITYTPTAWNVTHTDWFEWRENAMKIFLERTRSEIENDSTISAYLDGIAMLQTDNPERFDIDAALDNNMLIIHSPTQHVDEATGGAGRDDRVMECQITAYVRGSKGLDTDNQEINLVGDDTATRPGVVEIIEDLMALLRNNYLTSGGEKYLWTMTVGATEQPESLDEFGADIVKQTLTVTGRKWDYLW